MSHSHSESGGFAGGMLGALVAVVLVALVVVLVLMMWRPWGTTDSGGGIDVPAPTPAPSGYHYSELPSDSLVAIR